MIDFASLGGATEATPDTLAMRRKLAMALSQQATDTSPVGAWSQGAARIANGLLSGYMLANADKQEREGNTASAKWLAQALGGGAASPSVIPATAGQSPVAEAPAPPAMPDKVYANDELSPLDNLDLKQKIKGFEGFAPKAQWDYAQNTNGYGTKAAYAGEPIDRATADARLGDEVAKARGIADKAAPNASTGISDALTSLTFNAGDKWTRSGLGQALQSGNMDAAKDKFLQYNKAGGQTLPGLIDRRQQEAQWFNQPPPQGQPQQVATLGGMPTPDTQPMPPQAAPQQPNMQMAQALQAPQQQPVQAPQSAAIKEQIIRGLSDPNPYVRKQAQALGAVFMNEQIKQQLKPSGFDFKRNADGSVTAIDKSNPNNVQLVQPPGVSENLKKFEVEKAGAVERAKTVQDLQGKAEVVLPDTLMMANDALKVIEQVRDHPGIDRGTGIMGALPSMPGSKAKDFDVAVEQLKGKAFLQAFEKLRGGGAISDAEGRAATAAIARLNQAQSKEAFTAALGELENIVRGGIKNAYSKAGVQAPATSAQPNRGPQPGMVQDGYRFRGGNPADPNSWESVR